MNIHASSEDYLEAILAQTLEHGFARSIDVSRRLGVTRPSVSRAMTLLRDNGYVVMGDDGYLTLTPSGREIAERIYERHRVLTRWLEAIGVSPETAAEDACRIEHDLSAETFNKVKEFLERTM